MAVKPKYQPIPRLLNAKQVAMRLGMGDQRFKNKREELERQGFPAMDQFFGKWDGEAIERWLDKRSGLTLVDSEEWRV